MPLPPEIGNWIARSEVDHVGPFVNAWAAFNAWYRHVSGRRKDSEGLEHVRTQRNVVRSAILPMLDPLVNDTPDALAFREAVAQLHAALESFRLETLHNEKLEHVSLRSVPLRPGKRLPQLQIYSGKNYKVEKAAGKWVSTVFNRSAVQTFRLEQDEYDLEGLTNDADFAALSGNGKGQMRALYADCNPRPMTDLLSGEDPAITAGTIQFRCTCDDLFGGVIVTLYRMRNMLLHGELAPEQQALACYEPAYRLLRRMLQEVR